MTIKNFCKIILNILIAFFLTVITQIGGVIYLISILLNSEKRSNWRFKRVLFFLILYLLSTYFIVPKIAPIFGRVKIEDTKKLVAHTFITKLLNRNYVTPQLNGVLKNISLELHKEIPTAKVIYLDANFPFINGFPLLPHLSHNNGKKIDLSFLYKTKNGRKTNLKPSNSGYGIFVEPNKNEINQTTICKNNGFFQYDFTKYFTFGSFNQDLKLSEKGTKKLINTILKNKEVSKLFIEPHLKTRLKINNSKIRFHGCKAVRHDDHIHFQIK
jgi:hypothetical protein